jgi:uncharacterized protein YPO0396
VQLQAAEQSAAQALADNTAVAQEVEQMRSAVTRLQEEHDKAAAARKDASSKVTLLVSHLGATCRPTAQLHCNDLAVQAEALC